MLRFLFRLSSRNRDWSTMHVDILELISDRLPVADYIRFRSVCKQWRSSPSGRSELVNFSKDQQWLTLYELEENKTGTPKCYIYSQSHSQYCTIQLHDLEGAIVDELKLGWLLAHHGQFFFLYNPLTFSRFNLPKLNVSGDYACTFTYLPTNQECTITVVCRMKDSSLELSMCCVGDEEWTTQTIPDISSNQIGRIVTLVTCNDTRDEDNSESDIVCIHDSKNKLTYNYDTKQKSLICEYWKGNREPEMETGKQLGEMISKHNEEWMQKSGERGILLTYWNKNNTGKTVTMPRAFDEISKFDMVKGSFFEPGSFFESKSSDLGNASSFEPKPREILELHTDAIVSSYI